MGAAERAACYARERMRLDVSPGCLEDRGFDQHYSDVVKLWHVLEHFFDPMATLEEFHRILKPDGLLVISLPNRDSLEAKLFGRYWVRLDAPRHLWCFKPALLQQAPQAHGFEVIMKRCFEGGYFTFAVSGYILVRNRLARGGIRRAAKSLLYLPGLRLPFSLFIDVVGKLGRGSITTIYSRRKRALIFDPTLALG